MCYNDNMTAQKSVTIVCDGCLLTFGPVFITIDAARKRLYEDRGWHRTITNMDVCPECWAEGKRP